MKKTIKKLNRMFKELRPYVNKGCFLLGDSITPSKFIFYGLPVFYVPNDSFDFVQDKVSDKELDVLIDELSDSDYEDLMAMTIIIRSYQKAIYKFIECRASFDSMIYSGELKSKKALRVAMFRREPSYNNEVYEDKWQEIIDEKLSQSSDTEPLPVEDTDQKMEQKVSEETASA